MPLGGTAFGQEYGVEKAISKHVSDGQEMTMKLEKLVERGDDLFAANFTSQDGARRPLSKGDGASLSDPSSPLVGSRAANRISGPDGTSCAGCHSKPFDGGGGDFSAGVFVLSERFDHATFDATDHDPLKGSVDEAGNPVTLQTIGNYRASLGLFGSGYIELLARQITEDLRAVRDSLAPGQSIALVSERTADLAFGTLSRDANGNWITSAIVGLPASSLVTTGPSDPPSLILQPFHQSGSVVSIRQFVNDALNQHFGIQSVERFGFGVDADGDGIANEATIGDVSVLTLDSAQYPVPGRVIPRDKAIEHMVMVGEDRFQSIGCTTCHIPELPLADTLFTEPNPFNPPAGNLDPLDSYVAIYGYFSFDLNDPKLDGPRLKAKSNGVTMVPAFTDLKLHDITNPALSYPNDPDEDAIDSLAIPGPIANKSRFLTKKLWGFSNEPPFFHHGRYTTIRDAIEAHSGEAATAKAGWDALTNHNKNAIIEFLKTLQARPAESKDLIVDEKGKKRTWQKFAATHFE